MIRPNHETRMCKLTMPDCVAYESNGYVYKSLTKQNIHPAERDPAGGAVRRQLGAGGAGGAPRPGDAARAAAAARARRGDPARARARPRHTHGQLH